jgi:hypothetical protein
MRWRLDRLFTAEDFDDAERWDLVYRQQQTPEQRLSALVAIRREIEKVEKGKILSGRLPGTPGSKKNA